MENHERKPQEHPYVMGMKSVIRIMLCVGAAMVVFYVLIGLLLAVAVGT